MSARQEAMQKAIDGVLRGSGVHAVVWPYGLRSQRVIAIDGALTLQELEAIVRILNGEQSE